MNTQRILLGGLAAGVVSLVLGMAFGHVVMEEEMKAALGGEPAGWQIAGAVALRLGFGITVAWIYAAIRPRFGPGPRTAVLAGLAIWWPSFVLLSWILGNFGIIPWPKAALSAAWGLIECPLTALVAARLYRE